jgi:8-oxo-dGTP diphosphatase
MLIADGRNFMSDSRIEVVAGVLVRDACVLACQRLPGGHHPGKWEFPGGKVEAGESPQQALQRELREELAVDVTVGPLLWRTEHQYPGRQRFTLTFFLVSDYAGAISNAAFASVCWLPIEVLHEHDFLEGDREFIRQIEDGVIQLGAGPKAGAQGTKAG